MIIIIRQRTTTSYVKHAHCTHKPWTLLFTLTCTEWLLLSDKRQLHQMLNMHTHLHRSWKYSVHCNAYSLAVVYTTQQTLRIYQQAFVSFPHTHTQLNKLITPCLWQFW